MLKEITLPRGKMCCPGKYWKDLKPTTKKRFSKICNQTNLSIFLFITKNETSKNAQTKILKIHLVKQTQQYLIFIQTQKCAH